MKSFNNGIFNVPAEKIEIIHLPTIEVEQGRYDELIQKEAQLEFLKKLVASKVSYNNYADISDLIVLLDIKKG